MSNGEVMIRNVIFDMDGTVLNTLDDLCDSVNYMLSVCGYPYVSIDEVRSFVGNGIRLLVERALKVQVDEAEFQRCLAIFQQHYDVNKENKTAPYEGIVELMAALQKHGCKMAIVSNKYDAAVKELSDKLFKQYISAAVGESEDIKPKPQPDGVYSAMKALGAQLTDTVYIGDSDVDFATAANSNLPFIGVAWGFKSREFLQDLGTLYIADKPSDVLDIITARRYALVGRGLSHTMSPALHSELFKLSGVKAQYTVYDVESIDGFRPIVEGLNITIPYKQGYIDKLRGIGEFARNLGAINCVDANLVGYNTDYYGFIRSFKEFYTADSGSVLVLGYGGVGRVIVRALVDNGYEVTVAVRYVKKAINCGCKVLNFCDLDSNMHYDAIVNATPIGMYPNVCDCPIGDNIISTADYVYDTIYNPTQTQLVSRAIALGKKAKTAMDMLVYQAVRAHEIWYNAVFDSADIAKVVGKLCKQIDKNQ